MFASFVVAIFVSSVVQAGIDDSLPAYRTKGPKDYCIYDKFVSDCQPNEVVMFKSATYKHSLGGCKDGSNSDPNSTLGNCSLDVREELERTCLGKWSCTMDLRPHEINWRDAYKLECPGKAEGENVVVVLSYDCVSVEKEKSACMSCENSDFAKLSEPHGFLASIVTVVNRLSAPCGNARCPWYLRVPPGQVVNLTMIDSTHHSTHQKHSSLASDSSTCHKKYVTVKERANPKDFYYCGGKGRISHLYLSVSNSLEIQINDDHLSNVGGQFLIHYEVVGCADIVPPRFSRMKRYGDICEIDCPDTDLKWTLTCKGQTWAGLDELGSCPPAPGLLEAEPQKADGGAGLFSSTLFDMPMGVVMAMVIACAVILGVLILTTGLVCLKRNQYDAKHKDDPNIYGAACSEFEFREMGVGPVHPALLAKTAPYMNTAAFAANRSRRASADLLMRDNTYAMQEMAKMDTRPLPSLPTPQGNSWRRGDDPVPYGVVRFFPPGTNQPNRVTVQLHRTDSGIEHPATYRARPTRFAGPPGGRFEPRGTAQRRFPGPPGMYNDSQEENHYFVLDGNACNEEPLEANDQQTMMMTMSAMPFCQPPPAHQNRHPVTTMPRQVPPAGNSMMMMANHRHQHSFGGGDLRCTCEPNIRFPPPENYFSHDTKAVLAGVPDINKSSGSINNQI